MGISSQGKISVVAILDAIGGQPDLRKMWQDRAIDPKRA